MATVKIDLSLEDTKGSVRRRKSEVEDLNRELEKSKRLATGTQTGSGAVRASFGGIFGEMENQEYGRARGAMGGTGAAGRDFANQAQGLGGLVRLYATYAANVFAVSAAFNALSDAMNTTNMVRGLDQLGAASGVALGTLAKRFTEASGGAISLRESMEATAKAVSAGLSQSQFLRLGEVAKKASQALGVGMSDAVNRLTRGIVKLEPELLDELGIFTKIGPATENYARSVGKSADALTDFERRQAFANAVLAEGEKKFNEIQIPTNPYDKLLATLKDVAQSILEVINTAIVPLVSLLASSPTALTLGIAGLGSMIVKQAIPAIGEYRKGLREAAAVSKELADAKLARAESAAEAKRQDLERRAEAAAAAATSKVEALDKKLEQQALGKIRKDVKKIVDPTRDILDIKDSEIAKLNKIGDSLKTQNNIYKQLAQTITEARKANLDYIETAKQIEKERKEQPTRASTLGVLRADAERQRKSAASSAIISQAGDTASIDGFKVAYSEMIDQIKTEKLGVVRGALTGIAGAANAAAVRLGGLLSAFSNIGMIIGVVVSAYQMLSGWLSQNSAQQEKFNAAVDNGSKAVSTLNDTIERYKGQLDSTAIIATSTAFVTLADSIMDTVKALQQADAKAGGFDRFIDGIQSLFGKGLKADFERSIALQVSEGLKGINDPKIKAQAENSLKELLNVNTLTAKSIGKALSDIDKSDIVAKGKSIADVFAAASRAGAKTAAVLSGIKDAFVTLDRAYSTLANSLIERDPLTLFGKELAMQGFNLAEAFKDPIASVGALRDILTDVSKLRLLSPESQQILMKNKDAFIALTNSAAVYEQQIISSEAKIKDLEGKLVSRLNKAPIQREITQEQQVLAQARSRLSDTRAGLTAMSQEFAKASEASIKRGFEAIERSFVKAMAETSLNSQKTLVDALPKTAATIDLSVSLENQRLELQKQEILETQRLIKELELGRLSAEKRELERRRDEALQVPGLDVSIRNKIQEAPAQRLKEIEDRTKVLTSTNISRDVRAGKLERTPETLLALQQQQGAFAKVAAIASQQEMNLVKAEVDKITAFYATTKRTLDNDLRQVQAERDAYLRGEGFRQDSLEQQQRTLSNFTAQESSITRQLGLLDSQRELATAIRIQIEAQANKWPKITAVAGEAVNVAKNQLTVNANILDTTAKTNTAETTRKNILDLQLETLKLQSIEIDRNAKLSKLETDTQVSLINIQKEELQLQLDRNIISVDSYNQQLFALEKIERAKQRDARLSQLLSQYTLDMIGYSREYASATAAQIPDIRARQEATKSVYDAEVSGVLQVFGATEKLKEEQKALSSRQMAYTDLFKGALKSMEDAIIDFTKTGKLSFSSMINSFIEGLIRYEIQQQQLSLIQRAGGTRAVVGAAMNFLGIGGMSSVDRSISSLISSGRGLEAAKGAAFDYGVQAFAKGGTFTNSIVDSPTMFKFAKGTGLMGEAGPEAIMPLTRDTKGNLGVRAQGGGQNVEVVVNNYSTAQAETKETVDSRGNRRIEIVVGDMVAQEVSRTGSSTQNAFASTFGTRPALARR